MPSAARIYGTVLKGGPCTILARVLGHDGVAVVQGDFSGVDGASSSGECALPASYTVFLLDNRNPNTRTAVSGFESVTLEVTDIIYDDLQTDAAWTLDTTGYNFLLRVPACPSSPFTIAGRRYLVSVTLQPDADEPFLVEAILDCI